MLQKYIDKEVYLKSRKTNERKSCRLLAATSYDSILLEDNETKEIYINPKDEIILPSLPSNLMVKPALVWKVRNSKANLVKVSYLSKGFNWHVNYVVEIKNKYLNVSAWAEINNECGTSFENIKIKLMAGEVNKINKHTREFILCECDDLEAPHYGNNAEEKSFDDYHIYTLKNLTTLKNNQKKQLNLFNAEGIEYEKYYFINEYEDKVDAIIEFDNSEENKLGLPMPKGVFKIYKNDEEDNSLEFIGEDEINHTPKNEKIKLCTGKAFDITYEEKQVSERKIGVYKVTEYEYIIIIKMKMLKLDLIIIYIQIVKLFHLVMNIQRYLQMNWSLELRLRRIVVLRLSLSIERI